LGRCGALTILELLLHDVRITVVEAWTATEWDGECKGERGRAAWERSAFAGGGGEGVHATTLSLSLSLSCQP
jgi:hypothetical protein